MEALENTMVVGAILWLVQTILDTLLITGKLDTWVRQIGLADDAEKLRKEVMRIKTVVSAVKGRVTGNEPLAQSLARIRELLYDADDMLDELDYFRLQQQVEGGASAMPSVNEPEGTDLDGAEQREDESRDNPNRSSGSKKRKNRSKAWDHFEEKRDANGKLYAAQCISCRAIIKCGDTSGGTGLNKHIKKYGKCHRNPLSSDHQPTPTRACDDAQTDTTTNATLDSVNSKRMRTDEVSALDVTTNTYPWNKDNFSKRIHQIALELQRCRCDVIYFFKDSVASSDEYQTNISDTRLRTTGLVPRKVYVRDDEKGYIRSRVITAAESHIINVLPIVGIAGVGKTAVAQLVYNDPIVESQFERIWVCVSYILDEVTLTKEILECLPQERIETSPKIPDRHEGAIGLGKLQEILKAHMQHQQKRFLLILDDVWHNLDDHRWKRLLLPLQSGHVKGNVILVTTRDLSVAQRIGTEEPIQLGALENDEIWLLLKSFAFGDDDNFCQHTNLNSIGQEIAKKLKGNPLAAETAGKILRERLNLEHWSRTLKNEDWKSLQLREGIMPALKHSYDQLPYHLQQCFMYCSIFPDNYEFLERGSPNLSALEKGVS